MLLNLCFYQTVRKAVWRSSRGAKTVDVAVKAVKDGILNDANFVNEAETLKYVVVLNYCKSQFVCILNDVDYLSVA